MTNGIICKMKVEHGSPIRYTLELETPVVMNDYIGKHIRMEWAGKIVCTNCGKTTKNSFGQGFCYPCFMSAPQAAPCIISPELCRAHLGEGRDVEWERNHHDQPHVVYLAKSDSVKVGVTRAEQRMTRWMDQGAHAAIVLAETPNRFVAGTIEVALKSVMTDKTNWQRMLKNEINHDIDLIEEKGMAEDALPFDLRDYVSGDDDIVTFEYPVLEFPTKVKSVGFDKTPVVSGKLTGIKGQYLLFEDQSVINLRKHTGYEISFSAVE
ncbi:MAG TPA: DUF2797 domain-containing protein [Fluviicola sp.]|nr:DUF2797 domain-containing protein [Fluviicola sp.]